MGQRQRGCFKLETVCVLCSAGVKGDCPQKQDVPAEVRPSQIMPPQRDMYEQGMDRAYCQNLHTADSLQRIDAYPEHMTFRFQYADGHPS